MADRFPLVVNNTTNKITEVFSGDNLLFDNTQLITSTGNLVLNPAGNVDVRVNLVNTTGANLQVDDDFYVTENVGIGTVPVSSTDLKIGRTWNDAGVTFIGLELDYVPTASANGSKALRLLNNSLEKFSVDVNGNTNIEGTLNVEGSTVIDDTLNVTGATDLDSSLNVDGNTTLVGTLGVTGNTSLTTLTTSSSLTVTGLATFNSAIDANSTLNVQGAATFQDGIYPDTDEGASIGSSSLPWGVAHIGEITIADGSTGDNDNTISTATGDLFLTSTGGNVNITGQVSITHTGQDNNLRLVSTDATAAAGPDLVLWRNSATPAANDGIGAIRFAGNDSALNQTLYGRIYTIATDVVDGTENGKLVFEVIDGGTNTQAMSITGAGVTIEGNLTVQGTQTILNTSTLQVEDNTIELRKGNSITAADGGIQVNLTTDSNGAVTSSQQLLWDNSDTSWRTFDGTNYSSLVTERRNNDITGTLTVHSMLEDADYVTGAAPAATQDFSLRASNVKWFSVDATTDFTLNFKADASETLDSMMGVTEVATATCVVNNGGTAYKIGSVTVDGSAPTAVLWANGSSYPNGTVNAADVYVFTIIKTGSAAFTILASQSTFS